MQPDEEDGLTKEVFIVALYEIAINYLYTGSCYGLN